ncbi:MAG: class I SAM-dependent methyltransferase, partial [Phycisphaerales bacterium]|nr:class I SAM-dependent methyltransferase [Phycisphaerales bacterium]
EQYGLGDIYQRSRTDLPERNLFWLNQLLKLKLPPGKALEIGSAHGGFTFLMQQAGFEATGLELSPEVVRISSAMFGVPMLCGPVEEQSIPARSLDVIALMDVLEHLPDPLGTIRHCVKLLKPDGILLIQTPRFPAHKSFAELAATQDRFLAHLNRLEHRFLFSKDSARQLMQAAGAGCVEFYPAIFGFYDMFLAASPQPIREMPADLRDAWLGQTPSRRMVRALLDAEDRLRTVVRKYRELKRAVSGETLYAAA